MVCANLRLLKYRPKQSIVGLVCLLTCVFFAGCTSTSNSRYSIKQDTAPTFDYGEIEYVAIEPRFEPYNVWTSRPYKVLGEYYTPLITGKGYQAEGQASWYGQKFHGHKTANGEIFDMFGLSAAHKTLPLPSFVKVTNLENQESTIVRVNDRGPFHDDRLIDLSYGAAKKLGFHKNGVAHVKLEVIHINELGDLTVGNQATIKAQDQQLANNRLVSKNAEISVANQPSLQSSDPNAADLPASNIPSALVESDTQSQRPQGTGLFVQVVAMQNGEKAKSLAVGLSNLLQVPTAVPKIENIYKLQLGPIASEQKAKKLIQDLYNIGFEQAFTVQSLAD